MSEALHAKLNICRCTPAGAAVLVVLIAVCWAAAAAEFAGGCPMHISIFTSVLVASLLALALSLLVLVFGGVTGALIALACNGFEFVKRRERRQRAAAA
jgi:hypothetical protein